MQTALLVVGTANLVATCTLLGMGIVALKQGKKMKAEAMAEMDIAKKMAEDAANKFKQAGKILFED